MPGYVRTPGTLLEPVGHLWVAFSAVTGETALLNNESAAILEALDCGAATTPEVCAELGPDVGIAAAELAALVDDCWPRLIDAGLVREARPPAPSAP